MIFFYFESDSSISIFKASISESKSEIHINISEILISNPNLFSIFFEDFLKEIASYNFQFFKI